MLLTALHIGNGCISALMPALNDTHKASWHYCMHTFGVLGGAMPAVGRGGGQQHAQCMTYPELVCIHHKC
jgi:hypothetical protein